MRDVVHRACTAPHHIDYRRIGIDAQVLCYLVVGALYEGAIHSPHRAQSTLGHSRNHSHCLLFGNAHVDVLLAGLGTLLGRETACRRCARSDGYQRGVALHVVQHPVAEELLVGLHRVALGAAAVCDAEGCTIVPGFLVGYGGCKTMPLLRVDMHYGGLLGILHALEQLDEALHIIAFLQIFILKSPGAEPVVLTLPMTLPQRTQVLVDAAVVFCDGHLIVVDHDDDARSQFRRFVEPFECLAA